MPINISVIVVNKATKDKMQQNSFISPRFTKEQINNVKRKQNASRRDNIPQR